MYAFTAKTGELAWKFNGYDDVELAPVVANDKFRTVYATTKSNYLYAINASNGEMFWDFDAEEHIHATPAVSEDGSNIFFGNEDGTLFSLKTEYDVDPWSRYTGAEAIWKFNAENKVKFEYS